MNQPPGYRTIFKTISEKYDKDTLQKARTFNKIMLKTARHRRHLHFSHRCKDLQVLPPSLRIKPPVRTPKGWKLTKNVGFQFLKLRIEDTHKKIRTLTREKELALVFLRSRLTTSDLEHLETLVYEQQDEEYSRIRSVHSKKLQVLTSKSNISLPDDTVNRDKWVLNISSKPLNNTEMTALQKGTNFALAPKKIPTAEIVAGIEDGISGLPEDEKLVLRSQVSQVLQRATVPPPNLPQAELRALHNLRKDQDRLVIPADKGNCTVVMDRKDYDDKVQQMLNDQRTYKVLDKDPTQRTERKLNEKLANLKRENKISDSLYKRLRSSDGLPPRFYGLPKIHKPGFPLRPIVSFIDSPTYMLSKHLAQILSPMMGNTDFTVKNSVEFCEQMKNVSLKEDEELVSFDVVSLFTSIPVKLAIQVAKDLLSNDDTLQDRTTIPVDDIVDLLDFCLSTTNFKYNNNHYQEIFGTAMGSPVSAVMANLVMEDLEKRALSTSLSQPCFWKRYVDDVCAAVKSNLVLTLQNHLNNIEPSIQFTVERETERKISFLDVTVCRQDDGQLSTKVYRKPTHTERYLSFDSHHPVAHKRAVIKSLTDRAKTIPSSVDKQSKEMKHVIAALSANGYPKRFVIDASKPKWPSLQTPVTAPDDKKGFCILPYVKGTTEPIKRILSNYNIKVALKPHHSGHTIPSAIYFPNRKTQSRKIKLAAQFIPFPAKFVTKATSGKRNGNFPPG